MVRKIGPEDVDVTVNFGGGLHTRASADDINPREAADGFNFQLDLENHELRPRAPFDLIGTVPNGGEIRGGGSLLKADGTVSTIIQAGNKVYEWDGLDGFTEVGSCSSTAKLRGHWRTHNWTLDDELLLTDLNLVDTVKKWNGTTLSAVAFTNEASTGFGSFYAKYLNINNERAVFANIRDGSGLFPHMMVGAERGDYTVISVSNRPASGLSEEDPFFLLSPDLRPINGHVEAFSTGIISTEKGQLFALSGQSAKDFAFNPFYPGSGASGDESLAYIGNDIIYGRAGRIETVTDTDRYGDSAADDLSKGILDQIKDFTGWRVVYNSRLNRAYLQPDGVSELWVFEIALRGSEVSPWMRWRTNHGLAFQPTFMMSMLDPLTGLEFTAMGDGAGKFYRLEGSGDEGDGGSSPVSLEWLTKNYTFKLDAQGHGLEYFIRYRKDQQFDVEITFEFAGQTIRNSRQSITLEGITDANYYGGDVYYGGDYYYGTAAGRIARRKLHPPGQDEEFQIRIKTETAAPFAIASLGIRGVQASR